MNYYFGILKVMAHHVIYLPGVSDHTNGQTQVKALEKWRKYGIEPHFIQINWYDNETFANKLSRVVQVIDKLSLSGQTVSLMGASAGASMALNVYATYKHKDKISCMVLVCGKINNPQTLGINYKSKNPALLESVTSSAKAARNLAAADKAKIITINPIFDGTVAVADSRIEGVENKTLISFLHPASIYLSLTLYKKISINFIKSRSVQ
jgi:pimeloyl-ACP methyl ester carboxylesterase